ncbi:PH-like domain-containing protein [Streptomyces sp. 8N706]|uniref:PH-like domain-containing protein n=1 Tax=Streptomyces sp. 8N706 TaxID=3457416 RepID=UPI003FD0E7BA
MTPLILLAADAAAEPKSQEVTDWAARIGWVVGLLLFIALVYWLMREGWKWRRLLQSDLPELPSLPETTGEPRLSLTGRYHGSTTAGQWLDRIVAHGLGTRSRAELTLTAEGLEVLRPGARDFFVPVDALRGARLDKGIAGKVLTEGGLLVVTWQHGDRLIDSGFRSDSAAEHPAWVEALNDLSGDTGVATSHTTAISPGAQDPSAAPARAVTPEKGTS